MRRIHNQRSVPSASELPSRDESIEISPINGKSRSIIELKSVCSRILNEVQIIIELLHTRIYRIEGEFRGPHSLTILK